MRNKVVVKPQISLVTQYGIEYAIHVITDHFGNLVSKVCECLLRRGPLTRSNLKRYTELSDSQIKNCLLVLIQHNCVQAFAVEQTGGFGDAPRFVTQYLALFNHIVHRMRFSKFMKIVSQEFDGECLDLLEGLFEHGRLTLKQMFDRAKSAEKEGKPVTLDYVQEILLKLVTAHYVERCPAPEPVLAPKDEAPAKKRGPKEIEEPKTIEQEVLEAAVPVEGIRFSVLDPDVDGEKKDIKPSSMTAREKRKYDALESDEIGATTTVVYRANFEQFVRCLRHKACVDNVRARLDDGAATVLSAMLDATRNEETEVKTKRSASLSLSSIYEEVIKTEAGRNMTLEHLRASLAELGTPPLVKASDDSYNIEFEKIIELAQIEEVESIVLKRYGQDAYRIFRLLSREGRLMETEKIADVTFVEKRETPKILYKLWKDDYLHMEKLVLAAARQTQFMLWKVNKLNLWKHILDEMFHATLNLRQRLAYELDQEKELLKLPADKRTGALNDRNIRLNKIRKILQSSQMKLDDSIMLFYDF
ncbi:hypothetical protein LWI29_024534 [Acer saccharum]|uniref:DNA-directed RNA polymerase III subunit RPC3 n=1 Tax=Acer saccharum TaxID=4024 RepID=A0AA39SG91_ACESA|nr:hypothetical protein LWI29_024534 [Acer saccharum]